MMAISRNGRPAAACSTIWRAISSASRSILGARTRAMAGVARTRGSNSRRKPIASKRARSQPVRSRSSSVSVTSACRPSASMTRSSGSGSAWKPSIQIVPIPPAPSRAIRSAAHSSRRARSERPRSCRRRSSSLYTARNASASRGELVDRRSERRVKSRRIGHARKFRTAGAPGGIFHQQIDHRIGRLRKFARPRVHEVR